MVRGEIYADAYMAGRLEETMAKYKFKIGNKINVGREPWNKGLKTGLAPWRGKKRSPETIKKMSDGMKGKYNYEKHPAWKGDSVGYVALHSWVKKKLGKPTICTMCGKEELNPYKIHWANISGEYKRETDDWIRLCASCHHKMDNISEKGWKTRKEKNGQINTL